MLIAVYSVCFALMACFVVNDQMTGPSIDLIAILTFGISVPPEAIIRAILRKNVAFPSMIAGLLAVGGASWFGGKAAITSRRGAASQERVRALENAGPQAPVTVAHPPRAVASAPAPVTRPASPLDSDCKPTPKAIAASDKYIGNLVYTPKIEYAKAYRDYLLGFSPIPTSANLTDLQATAVRGKLDGVLGKPQVQTEPAQIAPAPVAIEPADSAPEGA
jgi:hypothetical protein